MKCKICDHPNRTQIDQAVMNMLPGEYDVQLKQIAQQFSVPLPDLKIHVMSCKPEGLDGKDSLVKKLKLQETDMLEEVINEYYATLSLIGERIRKMARESEDNSFARVITKPVVDLYLGAGNEIRRTTEALTDISTEINGPKNDSVSGLDALASAIRRSRNN